jgi:two-component system chemotaxis sensor kinase CheA
VVRVDLSRLDELMRITGEMVIHRARLEDQINRLAARNVNADVRSLLEVNGAIGRDLRELRESIMRVRLVPIAEIFARMPFVVRDLARETGKKVQLSFSGQQTEIDKYVVERLKDPLLHLVRNSISHGIETPGERMASGKSAQATLFLRASTIGDTVLIELGDDGRGIDVEKVIRQAAALGLSLPSTVTSNDVLNLICTPGFSTREEADRGAGRGVGMSVVQNAIRELGGTLSLETERNKGVRFSMRLPLTLAIADVFVLSARDQTCAVPQSFVQEIIQMSNDQVRRINHTEVIPYRQGILPLVSLRSMFGFENSVATTLPVLVLNSERGQAGLVVDRIHGQREVVVRALGDPLIQSRGIAGATELGDGRPVLILDGAALTSGVSRPPGSGNSVGSIPAPVAIAI